MFTYQQPSSHPTYSQNLRHPEFVLRPLTSVKKFCLTSAPLSNRPPMRSNGSNPLGTQVLHFASAFEDARSPSLKNMYCVPRAQHSKATGRPTGCVETAGTHPWSRLVWNAHRHATTLHRVQLSLFQRQLPLVNLCPGEDSFQLHHIPGAG